MKKRKNVQSVIPQVNISFQSMGIWNLILVLFLLFSPWCANAQKSIDNISISEIKRQAEAGNVGLQFKLGYYYENGKRVEKDSEQAKYWYEKAVTGGLEDAKPFLAMIYDREKNYSKAFPLFFSYANNPQNKKSTKGNSYSFYDWSVTKVGMYKFDGKGTEKDMTGAVEYLEKKRSTGVKVELTALYSCYAQLHDENKMFIIAKDLYDKEGVPIFLAYSYLYGIGCQQELSKVYEMLTDFANGKLEYVDPNGGTHRYDKSSQFSAQLCIGIANYFDKDKTNHYQEAVRWLESVINSKEAQDKVRGEALCLLARCYRFGRGVEKNIAKANELESESRKYISEDDYLKFISHFSSSY